MKKEISEEYFHMAKTAEKVAYKNNFLLPMIRAQT